MSVKNVIPFSYFVKIVSKGISENFTFNRLNALVITSSLESRRAVMEFSSSQEVGKVYGISSKEYAYAKTFFGYMSRTATMPERITFWNWHKEASPSSLVGSRIEAFDSIKVEGAFSIAINGGEAKDVVLDLKSVTSFSEAATVISAALTSAALEATCVYDATKGALVIKAVLKGVASSIGFAGVAADSSKDDISAHLGLSSVSGATVIEGATSKNLAALLDDISASNGNWVSVATLEDLDYEEDFKTVSDWVSSSIGRYVFVANDPRPSLKKQGDIVYEELFDNDGFIVNAVSDKNINALVQASIASVDFSAVGGAMNFNFIPASEWEDEALGTESEINAVDAQRVNSVYRMGGYGQSAVLWGEGKIFGKNFKDISGYVGNSWLKAQFEIAVANLLTTQPFIALRGTAGRGLILNSLQTVINMALAGGIIMPVRTGGLTATEKAAVFTATADAAAVTIIEETGFYIRPEALTAEDIKLGRLRILFLYTRNVPVNRVSIQNYVLGA